MNNYKICGCTLPLTNPDACKTCRNQPQIKVDYSNREDYTQYMASSEGTFNPVGNLFNN